MVQAAGLIVPGVQRHLEHAAVFVALDHDHPACGAAFDQFSRQMTRVRQGISVMFEGRPVFIEERVFGNDMEIK